VLTGTHGELPVTETVQFADFYWVNGHGHATTRKTFSTLASVDISGVAPYDRIEVETINYAHKDISLLMPLWTGHLSPERARQAADTLMAHFDSGIGLTSLPLDTPAAQYAPELDCLSLPWNAILLDGLLESGFKSAAAALLTRLMDTLAGDLRQTGSLHGNYHAKTGASSGARNHLFGLMPMRPFLHALGISSISADRLEFSGLSAFSFPITVQYQGKVMHFTEAYTDITFPCGSTVRLDTDKPHVVYVSD
jgi:hypothetical protein